VVCAAITRHNAGVATIRIYYPFHPYAGQELPVVYKPNRREEAVTVRTASGDHRKIPFWMTEQSAADYALSGEVRVHPAALLAVRELLDARS
jgi:hypothetical protein